MNDDNDEADHIFLLSSHEPEQGDETTIGDDSNKLEAATDMNTSSEPFQSTDQSSDFVPPSSGEAWGQGADAFASNWPDWPDSFDDKKG